MQQWLNLIPWPTHSTLTKEARDDYSPRLRPDPH